MRKQKSKAAFALERCRSSYEEICWTALRQNPAALSRVLPALELPRCTAMCSAASASRSFRRGICVRCRPSISTCGLWSRQSISAVSGGSPNPSDRPTFARLPLESARHRSPMFRWL